MKALPHTAVPLSESRRAGTLDAHTQVVYAWVKGNKSSKESLWPEEILATDRVVRRVLGAYTDGTRGLSMTF